MIISASRRTDIPAYYGRWFINRLEAGSVMVPNPMNRLQVSRVGLSPETVKCIVFWTKNPAPFMPELKTLQSLGYQFYFLFTVTPYGKEIEPAVPGVQDRILTFRDLAEVIGPERVIWRYDPIIISDSYDIQYHLRQFSSLASAFENFTDRCIISFVRFYRKSSGLLRNIGARVPASAEMATLLHGMQDIAENHNITINGCCLPDSSPQLAVQNRGCIDRRLIESLTGTEQPENKDRNQRSNCNCFTSIDIGMYNTCRHGCIYCYACDNPIAVRKNIRNHDAQSPMLTGNLRGDEKIIERAGRSKTPFQRKLF